MLLLLEADSLSKLFALDLLPHVLIVGCHARAAREGSKEAADTVRQEAQAELRLVQAVSVLEHRAGRGRHGIEQTVAA